MFPILFQLGPVLIQTADAVFAITLIFSAFFLTGEVRKRKLNIDFLTDHLPSIIIASLIGSRLWAVIESWSSFWATPITIIEIWDGNLSFYGGMISFLGLLLFWTIKKQENFWKWLDVLTPGAVFAMMFLSVGDFLSGANYGTPTTLPWGVIFDSPEVRYAIPVHPTQFYTALLLLLILLILMKFSKKKHFDGVSAALGAVLYFFSDGILEFFRGSAITMAFDLRLPMILSFIFGFAALLLLVWKTHPHIDLHISHHPHS